MVRALQRSIFGRNWGASFCSTTSARTPRRPRSMASVKPVGPAPTMRTCASMCLTDFTALSVLPVRLSHQMISLGCFHAGCNRLEIGEFRSFLHEVADGAFERLQTAVGGRAQRVLHLHRLEHDEGGAALQSDARLGEDARHRA